MSTMLPRRIFDKMCQLCRKDFVIRSGYSELSRWKMYVCTNLFQKSLRWRVTYFWHFKSLEQYLQWCHGGFLINVPIIYKDLLKYRDIANFLGGKCTFAPIYLKIPAMEGEIFLAFLIFWTMSTIVSRRIFDKRPNYGGRFVINSELANFQGGKCTFAPIYLKISAMEGEIFWAFFYLWKQCLQWCIGGFFW